MQVRYEEGSGPFTQDTLQTSLTLPSGQHVTGTPWVTKPTPSCTIGTLCEAEALGLSGLSLATDHGGYTGAGFAAGFESVGNAVSFTTTASTTGSYDLALRYANSQGATARSPPGRSPSPSTAGRRRRSASPPVRTGTTGGPPPPRHST